MGGCECHPQEDPEERSRSIDTSFPPGKKKRSLPWAEAYLNGRDDLPFAALTLAISGELRLWDIKSGRLAKTIGNLQKVAWRSKVDAETDEALQEQDGAHPKFCVGGELVAVFVPGRHFVQTWNWVTGKAASCVTDEAPIHMIALGSRGEGLRLATALLTDIACTAEGCMSAKVSMRSWAPQSKGPGAPPPAWFPIDEVPVIQRSIDGLCAEDGIGVIALSQASTPPSCCELRACVLQTGQQLWRQGVPAKTDALRILDVQGGERVIVASASVHGVRHWDLEHGRCLRDFDILSQHTQAAFCPPEVMAMSPDADVFVTRCSLEWAQKEVGMFLQWSDLAFKSNFGDREAAVNSAWAFHPSQASWPIPQGKSESAVCVPLQHVRGRLAAADAVGPLLIGALEGSSAARLWLSTTGHMVSLLAAGKSKSRLADAAATSASGDIVADVALLKARAPRDPQ